MPIARRAVDGDACVLKTLAGLVYVVDPIGEVPEVAAAGIFLRVPVVRQLDFGDALLAARQAAAGDPVLAATAASFTVLGT